MMRQTKHLFLVLLILCAFAMPAVAQSSEPIIVRVNSFNPTTRVYNMSCILPSTAGPDRTWSIRPDVSAAAIEYHTTTNSSLVTIDQNVMYHISCGAMNTTGYIMTDFHIDRRTALPLDKPYITVDQTSGRTLRARCNIPANVTQYSLNWVLNGHGGTMPLPQFNNQVEITYTVPAAQQWEITCNVWDIPRSQYSRGGLSIEFFNNGPAYIPTMDGCIPGDACPYVASPARPIAWVGAWPHNGTNTTPPTQNVTIASSTPSGSSVTIPEPNNQTFTIALNNPNSLPVMTIWRLNGITQSAAANALSYTFGGNYTSAGVYDVNVMVQSPQNTVSRMWTLTVVDTPQQNQTNTTCYNGVQYILATCTGGIITSDTFNGGRQITCAQGANSLSIAAWPKPDNTFEMYRQSASGIAPKICLGATCIQNNGFAKSTTFPICVGNSTPPPAPVCGNAVVEQGEQCDGSAPANAVCMADCTLRGCHVVDTLREGETRTYQVESASYETTLVFVSDPNMGAAEAKLSINGLLSASLPRNGEQLLSSGVRITMSDILVNAREGVASYCLNMSQVPPSGTSATLSHAQWFPQGRNTILVCNATGFVPTSYDFSFGDGAQNLNYNQNNVWHTYPAAGTYEATCTARNGAVAKNATLSISFT